MGDYFKYFRILTFLFVSVTDSPTKNARCKRAFFSQSLPTAT